MINSDNFIIASPLLAEKLFKKNIVNLFHDKQLKLYLNIIVCFVPHEALLQLKISTLS